VSGIQLASPGERAVIEVARSGAFVDRHGTRVVFTPADLAALAESFDRTAEHKIKIGHVPIDTAYPDYGDVVDLSYDGALDRLLATIVPTPATIEKNRREGFARCSMELARRAGRFVFGHLALLGAAKPAIDRLMPIHLSAPPDVSDSIAVLPEYRRFAFSRVEFSESAAHIRTLEHLAWMRQADPKATYTNAFEDLGRLELAGAVLEEVHRRPPSARDIRSETRVPFAESPAHDQVLDYLAMHPNEGLTYTQAFERVGGR
jgi:hypothetical protein